MTSRYFTIFPDFYPRPPRGGRQPSARMDFFKSGISIHALREEGDIPEYYRDYLSQKISIHALREEGDLDDAYSMMEVQRFLSTPSARRATPGGGRRSGGG